MIKLDIEITPVEKFEVKINGTPVGEFECDSSWEGMVKLKNKDGVIIASDERSLIDKMFSGVITAEKQSSFSVLKITPSLIPAGTK